MKKLKLDVAELRVESFESTTVDDERGTVHGASDDSRQFRTACEHAGTCVMNMTCNSPGMCFPDSGLCGSGMPDC